MPATPSVVVVGDALIDELRDAHGVREHVGGAGLNVAVGLARLGVPATLVAMLGDDPAGGRIAEHLADAGVRLIPTTGPHGSSRAVSTRNAAGEPRYEFNLAARRRAIRFSPELTAAFAEASFVVVSCFPFDDTAQSAALAAALSAAGTPLAVDPNPRTHLLADRDEFVRGFETLAARSALVKLGDDDAELLYGAPLVAVAARLHRAGAGAVLATMGAGGAAVHSARGIVARPVPSLPGAIVDTMGAGDAILAATVASLVADTGPGADADTGDWAKRLDAAMLVAAATCRHEGALLRRPDD
ncbi:PfkB family carbohydrate kinase [Agromyces mediolanus]|uniref:PfkB family carbohydrate kinase n=1 Tax=Agromyces mediolanus TaxID=41986 RepID=UPI002040CAC5|nr:PfkB family carbohydrate kinase [Agromyces mediolanus]MCM3657841.1 PfkB family carbohydrate kinase [Agromyces mediolanus]